MSKKPLEPDSTGAAIVRDEQELLARVEAAVGQRASTGGTGGPVPGAAYDQELISLRDQIGEAKPEDIAPLVEQMSRVAALAAGRRRDGQVPIDAASPYFAHLRLREPITPPAIYADPAHVGSQVSIEHEASRGDKSAAASSDGRRVRDILIGRKGFIDRPSGVQVVDWRDAPVSQIYYRFDEGDDYDETVDKRHLQGVVEARRNVSIHGGLLRRVGCPQGTFVASAEGRWFEAEGMLTPTLAGGQGKAARAPRPMGPRPPHERKRARASLGVHSGAVPRADKHLPEIAALIDPAQFDLITAPSSGLVVIQGGAGSGKTTVALHRVAYLVFNDPQHFRPSRCLVVVPSQALERYVAGVLPALGVRGVPVVTFGGWARATRRKVLPGLRDKYTTDTPSSVSRVKKHPAILQVLAAFVAERTQAAAVELGRAAHSAEARAKVQWAWEARRERPPIGRFASMGRWLASPEAELEPAERQRLELALARARRALRDVKGLWGEVLTDEGRLRRGLPVEGAEAVPESELREVVSWVTAQQEETLTQELAGVDPEARMPVDGAELDDSERGRAAGRLDIEDDPLLLRMYQLLHGGLYRESDREPITHDHIAIDEAQDLSAVEIKVLVESAALRGPAANPVRSLTLAGDVAQRVVFDNAFRGWDELLADLGLKGQRITGPEGGAAQLLRLSYRSTEEVMRFARQVLGPLADDTEIMARPGAPVELHRFDAMGEAVGFLAESLRSLSGREPTASVALIARYPGTADAYFHALARAEVPSLRRVRRQDFTFTPGVDVTDVTQVKGLEFDYVVLLDVTPANYPLSVEARHLLHIGATRAAHQLWLVTVGTPSPLLPAELWSTEAE